MLHLNILRNIAAANAKFKSDRNTTISGVAVIEAICMDVTVVRKLRRNRAREVGTICALVFSSSG